MTCDQDAEHKRLIAHITLSELPLKERAEWEVHERRLGLVADAVERISISREDAPVNCANARDWQRDVREALDFIQRQESERLMGKEAQLLRLTRAYDALVESCIEMGL